MNPDFDGSSHGFPDKSLDFDPVFAGGCVDVEGEVLNICVEDVIAVFLFAKGDIERPAEAVGSNNPEGLVG